MPQTRRDHTPRRLLEFWEAVMLANHADPWKSRLQGRPMKGMSAFDDLIQAQDCCCCFTLPTGLTILGTIDRPGGFRHKAPF